MTIRYSSILPGLRPPEVLKGTPVMTLKWIKIVTILVTTAVVRLTFITVANLYGVLAYILLLAFIFPLRYFAPDVYWFIESFCYRWYQYAIASWGWSAGYSVEVCGEDVTQLEDEPVVVLVNHQSTADVPVLMHALQPHGQGLSSIMWIVDIVLKYTHMGLVLCSHGDFCIRQGKKTRKLQSILLREHILEKYLPRNRKWIVVYPEGGLFWKRVKSSQEYGKKNGFPHLEHCTLPRAGALQAILQTLNKETTIRPIKWIIDVTIAYPQSQPLNLITIVAGQRDPMVTTVHFRKIPISEVPLETEDLRDWLFNVFVEKDRMLDAFSKTGTFPIPEERGNSYRSKPEKVELNALMVVCAHALPFLLLCIEIYILYSGIQMIFNVLF